ncbi:MAG: hypothetical protein JO027_19570 [Solirubrobacterales bacterium]|nr:hypothetical protein [Solirubrobacterales bacterium]
MRKIIIPAAAVALAIAGCGSQAGHSSKTRSAAVRTTLASAVSWTGPVNAPAGASIVGTWSGHLTPPPGSHAPRQRFLVVIDPGERRGTWRISSTCAGTLRLKDISYGYHHYNRVAGAHPGCAAPGVDCLKRSGAQMVDVFVPKAGGGDINGTFRRAPGSA